MNANFVPKRKVITAITNSNPAIVTAGSHGYDNFETVRINVPLDYGMRLACDEVKINVINENSFSIDQDTTLLDSFILPTIISFTASEALPISQTVDNIAI
jgi:hypothetical protein